jgi:hypothetical protein
MNTEGNGPVRDEAFRNAEMLKNFYLNTFDFYLDTLRDYKKSVGFIKLAGQIAPDDPEVKKRLSLLE